MKPTPPKVLSGHKRAERAFGCYDNVILLIFFSGVSHCSHFFVFFSICLPATSIIPEGGCAVGWEERRSGGKQCGKFWTTSNCRINCQTTTTLHPRLFSFRFVSGLRSRPAPPVQLDGLHSVSHGHVPGQLLGVIITIH